MAPSRLVAKVSQKVIVCNRRIDAMPDETFYRRQSELLSSSLSEINNPQILNRLKNLADDYRELCGILGDEVDQAAW
jgi:hypothetical protein